MKLNKIVQAVLVSCSILALASCAANRSADGNGMDEATIADANGAQSSGLGQDSNFGGKGNMHASNNNRTYYFDFDKSDVRSEDKPAILANGDYLAANPNKKIVLEGHTDPRGSREYNVALAERRANSVYEVLKSKGVSPDQVRVVSYGAERLAVPGHSDEDYQQDRRAIIVIAQK